MQVNVYTYTHVLIQELNYFCVLPQNPSETFIECEPIPKN